MDEWTDTRRTNDQKNELNKPNYNNQEQRIGIVKDLTTFHVDQFFLVFSCCLRFSASELSDLADTQAPS